MTSLPQVRFANSDVHVTRLISGANPICGNSHVSIEMSEQMLTYFTDEQSVAYLHQLEAAGINPFDPDVHRQLSRAYGTLGEAELAERALDFARRTDR